MKHIALITLILISMLANAYALPDGTHGQKKPDYAIVLHGLGRSAYSMGDIAKALKKQGYEVHNLDYPSTRDDLPKLIHDMEARLRPYLEDEERTVNFVCYSLGCLLTRGIIHQNRPEKLGRVVMLGPPNHGSEMADFLKDSGVSNWVLGPVLSQLGVSNRKRLEKEIGASVDYPVGIIAGNEWIDPVGASIIPGDNDGRVSVENTMLEGMTDHIVLAVSHTFLITNKKAIEQTVEFLKEGKFLK